VRHRADKRRQHRAGATLGQELSQGGRPGDRVRDRRPGGAELVLGGDRQPLHRARAERGQLRAVRGRAEGDRREGTRGRLRAHRRHRVGVLRRGGQAAPGAAGVPVLDARAGRRRAAQRPVRGVPPVRDGRSAGAQAPAGVLEGRRHQAVRQPVVQGRPALHRQRGPVRMQDGVQPAASRGQEVAATTRARVRRSPVAAGPALSRVVLHDVHHGAGGPGGVQRDVHRARRPGDGPERADRRLDRAVRVRRPGAVRRLPVVQGVRVAVPEGRAAGMSRRRSRRVRVVPQQFRTRRHALSAAASRASPFERRYGRIARVCRRSTSSCGCGGRGRAAAVLHRTRDRNDGQVLRYVAALRHGRPDDHRPVGQASRAHGDHGTRNGVRVLGPAAVFRPLQSADDRGPHKHRAGRDGDIVVVGPEKQIHHVLIYAVHGGTCTKFVIYFSLLCDVR